MSKTPAKYHLTEDEIKNIKFRRTVFDYIANAINSETSAFVFTQVRPRLNLKEDVMLELSEDGEWVSEITNTNEQPNK